MTNIRDTAIAAAVSALALTGMASPAFAADHRPASSTRNSSAAVARTEAPSPDQRVCARFVPTGSMITRTVCRTRGDWTARYDAVPGEER